MFWADSAIEDFIKERQNTIDSKKSIIIRDEKTPSGRVHVGSMRGVAMHGIFSKILKEKGIKSLIAKSEVDKHRNYLKRVGFKIDAENKNIFRKKI